MKASKQNSSLPFAMGVLGVLGLSSLLSMLLLLIRTAVTGSWRFWFLPWNLFLGWLPLLFALGLRFNLTKKPWQHWQNIGLSALWLGFLPNSFYIMSDLIHLQSSGETSVLYDIGMMMSFVINGLILGFIAIYLLHLELKKRLALRHVALVLGLVFLSCGFAIYLGRYLRWNTWDIVVNPAGLLFDLSESVINPLAHSQAYVVTFVFFAVLSSAYLMLHELIKVLGKLPKA